VKALDRKLLRDLLLMWSQALTIALVVASGVGGFLTTLSAVDSLAYARDAFYASGRFADVFATVKRAPDALVQTLHDIPASPTCRRRASSTCASSSSTPAWRATTRSPASSSASTVDSRRA